VFYQRAKEDRVLQKLNLRTPEQQQLAISAAQTQGAAESQPATGSGEMMGLSTLQFNRNRKAIDKTINELASGVISEAAARVFLSSVGMSESSVQALIDDAKDGSVDTLPAETPSLDADSKTHEEAVLRQFGIDRKDLEKMQAMILARNTAEVTA
jgi:hypothetical protein